MRHTPLILAALLATTALSSAAELPGYLYPDIKIGMLRPALEAALPGLTFIQDRHRTLAAIIPFDKHTTIFTLQNDRIVEITYGWNDRNQTPPASAEIIAQTRALLTEFTHRFGLGKKVIMNPPSPTARARVFAVTPTEIALVQSASFGPCITITTPQRASFTPDSLIAQLSNIRPNSNAPSLPIPPIRDYLAEPLALLLPQ